MKKTIKGFLHYSTWVCTLGEIRFYESDMSDVPSLDVVLIKPHEFEVDIPDDFDPRPAQIKALEAKEKEAAAAFYSMQVDIQRQISQLQALEVAA